MHSVQAATSPAFYAGALFHLAVGRVADETMDGLSRINDSPIIGTEGDRVRNQCEVDVGICAHSHCTLCNSKLLFFMNVFLIVSDCMSQVTSVFILSSADV